MWNKPERFYGTGNLQSEARYHEKWATRPQDWIYFNPAAGFAGKAPPAVWDLGVGSIFFKRSTALDPGC
jgi:hypothetical protein